MDVPTPGLLTTPLFCPELQEVAARVADTKAARETRALNAFFKTLQADVGKATYGLQVWWRGAYYAGEMGGGGRAGAVGRVDIMGVCVCVWRWRWGGMEA